MATQTATPSLLSVASPIARPQHPTSAVPSQQLDSPFQQFSNNQLDPHPSALQHNGSFRQPPSRTPSARPPLQRARTDITTNSIHTDESSRRAVSGESRDSSSERWTMRHGFNTQYGPEQLRHLTSVSNLLHACHLVLFC